MKRAVISTLAVAALVGIAFLLGIESGEHRIERLIEEDRGGIDATNAAPSLAAPSLTDPSNAGRVDVTTEARPQVQESVPETPRQLPADYARHFMAVELDEYESKDWNHQRLLDWGVGKAAPARVIPAAFDHAFERLPISSNKPLERASDEQREQIEALQATYLGAVGDLLAESRLLSQHLVEETNRPEKVQWFESEEALVAADPKLSVGSFGYVVAWKWEGQHCILRFDAGDDAQLAANLRHIELHKAIRDREVLRIMAGVE